MDDGNARAEDRAETSTRANDDPMVALMNMVVQTVQSMNETIREVRQEARKGREERQGANPVLNPVPPFVHVPGPAQVTLSQFVEQGPMAFKGVKDPIEAEGWISELEKIYDAIGCTDRQRVRWAIYKWIGEADEWWKMVYNTKTPAEIEALTWADFKKIFLDKYFPQEVKDQLEADFLRLEQREDEPLIQYEERFTRMADIRIIK